MQKGIKHKLSGKCLNRYSTTKINTKEWSVHKSRNVHTLFTDIMQYAGIQFLQIPDRYK